MLLDYVVPKTTGTGQEILKPEKSFPARPNGQQGKNLTSAQENV
jgi:hypothetical protein